MRLSFDDFCKLTTQEFTAVCEAYNRQQEGQQRGEWERMRILAAITIQPHTKKTITPQRLLPLPWDNERKTKEDTNAPKLTKEQQLARFEELVKRQGK